MTTGTPITETPKNYPITLPRVSVKNPLHETVETAKRVINLLLEHADGIKDDFQYFMKDKPVNVPDRYDFGEIRVFFIPGWGRYTIGKGEHSITLSLPEGREDLLSDVETAKKYITKLDAHTRTHEQRRIKESWERYMTERGRMR